MPDLRLAVAQAALTLASDAEDAFLAGDAISAPRLPPACMQSSRPHPLPTGSQRMRCSSLPVVPVSSGS